MMFTVILFTPLCSHYCCFVECVHTVGALLNGIHVRSDLMKFTLMMFLLMMLTFVSNNIVVGIP